MLADHAWPVTGTIAGTVQQNLNVLFLRPHLQTACSLINVSDRFGIKHKP